MTRFPYLTTEARRALAEARDRFIAELEVIVEQHDYDMMVITTHGNDDIDRDQVRIHVNADKDGTGVAETVRRNGIVYHRWLTRDEVEVQTRREQASQLSDEALISKMVKARADLALAMIPIQRRCRV
jgi:hypothetical protein